MISSECSWDGGEKKNKQNSDTETSQKVATLKKKETDGGWKCSRLIMSNDRHGNNRVKYPGSVTEMLILVNSEEVKLLAHNSAQQVKMCQQRKIFLQAIF